MSSPQPWMLENCKNSVANEQNNIMIEHRSEERGLRLLRPYFRRIWSHFFFPFSFVISQSISLHLFATSSSYSQLIFYSFGATDPLQLSTFFSLSTTIQNRVNLQIPLPSSASFFLLLLLLL